MSRSQIFPKSQGQKLRRSLDLRRNRDEIDARQRFYYKRHKQSERRPVGNKRRRIHLSPGELEVMALLWNEGPRTIAQAHQSFGNYGRPIGYPTMQTRLNRLVAKGLVKRSEDRPAAYEAAISQDQVGAGHLSQLLEKVGRGIVVPLVAHLLAEGELTPQEIGELKRLLSLTEESQVHRNS